MRPFSTSLFGLPAAALLAAGLAFLAPGVACAKKPADLTNSTAPPAVAKLRVAIAVPPDTFESNMMRMSGPAEEQLGRAMPVPVKVTITRRLRETLRGALAGEFDALWVPSTMAAAVAATKRFEIVGYDATTYRIALVVAPGIQTVAEAAQHSLTLAQEDSPASTVATAMLSERGVPVARFAELHVDLSYETALFGVANRLTSTTAVPEDLANDWLAKNPKAGHVLELSAPLPGQTLVLRNGMDEAAKQALQAYFAKSAGATRLTPPGEAFKYATGLTHYTPDEVQGVTKVGAKKVQELLAAGDARVVDVRTQSEFEAKHIPNALWLPYMELSARVEGSDLARDSFDLGRLKDAKKVVFYCNGPECWKSFKAAQMAKSSRQFASVFWFRGGLPEWERTGLPVTR